MFIYSIGIDIGPRFLASLRDNGLKLNLLAFLIVFLGVSCAIGIKFAFNLDASTIAGLFTGGVTNTPGLGAAQAIITEQFSDGKALAEKAGMAYAIAYPFGIIGIILAMTLIRKVFVVKVDEEVQDYKKSQKSESGTETIQVKVTNPNAIGKPLTNIKKGMKFNFVLSRIFKNG
ncbi:MAG: transporter, partial [Polaribacter sp.]